MENTAPTGTGSWARHSEDGVSVAVMRRLGVALLTFLRYFWKAFAEPTVWNGYWMGASAALWRSER